LFIVLRAQVVRVILGSGNFSWEDTRLTAACLALFVVSLVAQSLRLLFTRSYYAAGNTKKPLIINLFASVLTIVLPLLFIVFWKQMPAFGYFIQNLFKVEDVAGAIILTLPLGYSLGTIGSMIALWIAFKLDFAKSLTSLWRTFCQSFSASIITGFVAYLMLSALANYLDTSTVIGLFLQGFGAGIAGILAGIGVLALLKSRELKEVSGIIPRKIFGEKNVVLDEVSKIE
jgi:putative peptidoglycan lipid II flippase